MVHRSSKKPVSHWVRNSFFVLIGLIFLGILFLRMNQMSAKSYQQLNAQPSAQYP